MAISITHNPPAADGTTISKAGYNSGHNVAGVASTDDLAEHAALTTTAHGGGVLTSAQKAALTGGTSTNADAQHRHDPAANGAATAAALTAHAALTTAAHGGGVLSTAQVAKVQIVERMEFQCANDFDPSVSGYTDPATSAVPPIGSRMTSIDGIRHWRKWGPGTTQWVAEHEITATLTGPRTTIACSDFTGSLACDTLGGFVWSIHGTATTTNPNVYFTFAHTGSVPSGNRQVGHYNHGTANVDYSNSAFLGSFGSGAFQITIEARPYEVLSTIGVRQRVHVSAIAANWDLASEVVVYRGADPTEITNPGLVITGGTFDAGCKVSLRR